MSSVDPTAKSSVSLLKRISDNLIDLVWEPHWLDIKINYGFLLFLILVGILLIKSILRRRNQSP